MRTSCASLTTFYNFLCFFKSFTVLELPYSVMKSNLDLIQFEKDKQVAS